MEQVFDFQEFVFSILHRLKLLLILGVIFGLLGAAYGFYSAGRAGEGQETFTATSAAAVNLVDGGEIPYWTPASIMATVDAVSGSDFVYANFADELASLGLSEVFEGAEDPSVADIKLAARFYIKGNLLMADITTPDKDLSRSASEAAISYLAKTVPGLLNHVSIVPQDKQTINVTAQPAPSKLRKAVKYGALGCAGGIVLGFLFGFFFDVFDLKIRSEKDLRKFGIPVLGILPEGGKAK